MQTTTRTSSFTITEARYVTSKIASDLQSFKALYGYITDQKITDFAEEVALHLANDYLESVEYGLKRDDKVIFSLKYDAKNGVLTNDRPGKIPDSLNTNGAVWYSYLIKNSKFDALSTAEQEAFKNKSPVTRVGAPSPVFSGNGYWSPDKSYAANSQGVNRNVFKEVQ